MSNSGKVLGGIGAGAIVLKLAFSADNAVPFMRSCTKTVPEVVHQLPHLPIDDVRHITHYDDYFKVYPKAGSQIKAGTHPKLGTYIQVPYMVSRNQDEARLYRLIDQYDFLKTKEKDLKLLLYLSEEDEILRVEESLQKFIADRNKLNEAFENNHPLFPIFDDAAIAEIVNGKFFKNLNSIPEVLFPHELNSLPNTPEANDIYSLFMGFKLNEEQAAVLSEITGRNLKKSTDRFDHCVLLQQKSETYWISTTQIKYKETTLDFKDIPVQNRQVIFNGKMGDNLAEKLSSKNVKNITEFSTFIKPSFHAKKEFEILFVASTDVDDIINLFEVSSDQALELSKLFSDVSDLPHTKLISTEDVLRDALKTADESNKNVVVVFNNKGTIFNKPVQSFNITNPITCKSYTIEGNQFGYQSTDFIYIEDAVKALGKITEAEDLSLNEIYYQFSLNYNAAIREREKKAIIATVTVATGATVTTAAIIYHNKN